MGKREDRTETVVIFSEWDGLSKIYVRTYASSTRLEDSEPFFFITLFLFIR